MGQSLKALVQLGLIISGAIAFCAWVIQFRIQPVSPSSLFGSTAVFGALLSLLILDARRRERLPDLLLKESGSYFEKDGFCFALSPIAVDGRCWMRIFFQNRYANGCDARVVLQAKASFWSLTTPGSADVNIHCEGGAFGVCGFNFPIPRKCQGKTLKFELAAESNYPNGRGKKLRFRDGLRVGTPPTAIGTALSATMTVGLAMVGALVISKPAHVKISLPTDVAETIPEGQSLNQQIIWRPDAPTGGFPVIM
jgi:hypothetical protein